jgi:hypothetical protein
MGGSHMIEAITLLRKIAEDTEMHAREAVRDPTTQADLVDIAVKWYWLAGEAAKLCSQTSRLSEAAIGAVEKHEEGFRKNGSLEPQDRLLIQTDDIDVVQLAAVQ